MKGAWHYHEAERLLVVATTQCPLGSAEQDSALAQAAIHAQLANTAAVIDTHDDPDWERSMLTESWGRVMNTDLLGGPPR